MKNLLFYTLLSVLVISCAKDDQIIPESKIKEDNSSILKGNKVDVCHNGNIINVNVNALPAHQAHGDAIDMDGDGYFDIDNPCSETDCDDTTYSSTNSCGCLEGEVEIDFNGPLFVAPADEAGSYNWQGAINACAAKAAVDGCGWYLPTKEELHALFLERANIGGFDQTGTWPTSWYWSSTELYVGGGDARAHFFWNTGDQQIFNKVNGFRCRCVRR